VGFLIVLLVLGEVGLGIWLGCLWARLDELSVQHSLNRIDRARTATTSRIRDRRRQAESSVQDVFANSTLYEEPEAWRR
jgi:hypothetical protein